MAPTNLKEYDRGDCLAASLAQPYFHMMDKRLGTSAMLHCPDGGLSLSVLLTHMCTAVQLRSNFDSDPTLLKSSH